MVTAKLEETDYLYAQALHRRWSRRKLLIVGALVVAAAILSGFLWQTDYAAAAGGITGGLIGGVVGGAMVRYVFVPWKTRRVFRQQKSLHREFTLSWSDDGLVAHDANGQYKTAWSDFTDCKENDRLFLLYHSDIVFQMVPKRAFPNAAVMASFQSQLQKVPHV